MDKLNNGQETYQHFKDKVLFMPMFSPYRMIELGIHEGCLFHPGDFFESLINKVTPDILRKIEKIDRNLYTSTPNLDINFFKCLEMTPPFARMDDKNEPIDSKSWFLWYIHFYEGKRGHFDYAMINWWAHVILWGQSQPQSAALNQMLLQYSWNHLFKFKGKPKYYGIEMA